MPPPQPVVIFCYNRPDKLEALLHDCCEQLETREVTLVIDGPKHDRDREEQVRIQRIFASDCSSLRKRVIQIEKNLTPRYAIPVGLNAVFTENTTAIVLEDDIVVGQAFFEFADRALFLSQHERSINGFTGFRVPISKKITEGDTVLMERSHISWPWGWGVTRESWSAYTDDISKYSLPALMSLSRGIFPSLLPRVSWALLLLLTQQNKNQSWFMRWQLQCFAHGYTFLLPSSNLVSNRGCDSSGTHTSAYQDPSGGAYQKHARAMVYEGGSVSRNDTEEFYRAAMDMSVTKALRMVLSAFTPRPMFFKLRALLR